jgi:hypothetical protein
MFRQEAEERKVIMKEKIVLAIFLTIIKQIFKACLDEATQKKFVDSVLDAVETFVKRTDNALDDELILPLINSIRNNFGVPQQDMSIQ